MTGPPPIDCSPQYHYHNSMYVGNLTEKILVNFNFSIASIDYLILADLLPEEVGHVHMHYLLYGGFHMFLYTLANSLM